MYVGFSRVHANRHWADDVFAGATFSLIANWIFTKPYADKATVSMHVSGDYTGVGLHFSF